MSLVRFWAGTQKFHVAIGDKMQEILDRHRGRDKSYIVVAGYCRKRFEAHQDRVWDLVEEATFENTDPITMMFVKLLPLRFTDPEYIDVDSFYLNSVSLVPASAIAAGQAIAVSGNGIAGVSMMGGGGGAGGSTVIVKTPTLTFGGAGGGAGGTTGTVTLAPNSQWTFTGSTLTKKDLK